MGSLAGPSQLLWVVQVTGGLGPGSHRRNHFPWCMVSVIAPFFILKKSEVWSLIKQKGVLIKWFLPGFRVVALVPVLLLGCDGLLGSGVSRGLIRPLPVLVVPAISSLPG